MIFGRDKYEHSLEIFTWLNLRYVLRFSEIGIDLLNGLHSSYFREHKVSEDDRFGAIFFKPHILAKLSNRTKRHRPRFSAKALYRCVQELRSRETIRIHRGVERFPVPANNSYIAFLRSCFFRHPICVFYRIEYAY